MAAATSIGWRVSLFLFVGAVLCSTFGQAIYEPYGFTTVAGAALSKARDGVGNEARFDTFKSLASGKSGTVYAIDNSGLRKVTAQGAVTTLARGVFADAAVNSSGEIYVADSKGNLFTVSEIGTLRPRTELPQGTRLSFDRSDNLYVLTSNAVVKIPPRGAATMVATTNGIRSLNDSYDVVITDIVVDARGDVLAANLFGPAIFKSTPGGTFGLFVGSLQEAGFQDGASQDARLSQPTALAADAAGNVYFLDGGYHRVRKISPTGMVSTLAAWAGVLGLPYVPTCTQCGFTGPMALTVNDFGDIVVGALNTTLLAAAPSSSVHLIAGMPGGPGSSDGLGESARFGGYPFAGLNVPHPAGLDGVTVAVSGEVYVSDPMNGAIRKVTPDGAVTTITRAYGNTGRDPLPLVADNQGNIFVGYISAVTRIDALGKITTIAGSATELGNVDGPGSVARFGARDNFFTPGGGLSAIARDPAGSLYVYDTAYRLLKKIEARDTNWFVVTLTNFVDLDGTPVKLGPLSALVGDAEGNVIVMEGAAVRKLTPDQGRWKVATIAGSLTQGGFKDGVGPAARFGGYDYASPLGLAVDPVGNIFVSDSANQCIRKVSRSGSVTTLAGGTSVQSDDGIGASAGFSYPHGIAADAYGNVYVADFGNFTLRKGFPSSRISSNGSNFGLTDGIFRFDLQVPVGNVTVIEASQNLVSWEPLSTNYAGGTVDVSATEAASRSLRFFRAKSP